MEVLKLARRNLRQFIRLRKSLWRTGRPQTGVFAFAAVCAGFTLYLEIDWPVMILTAMIFAVLAMLIMAYNDYCDRSVDARQGRDFAWLHADELLSYCRFLGLVVLGGLLGLVWLDTWLAIYCFLAGAVGLLYSHAQKRFLLPGILVAIVSGLPILVGLVHAREIKAQPIVVFIAIACVIFVREMIKDIPDRQVDAEHKGTLPVMTASYYPPGSNLHTPSEYLLPSFVRRELAAGLPPVDASLLRSVEIVMLPISWMVLLAFFVSIPLLMAVALNVIIIKFMLYLLLIDSSRWQVAKKLIDIGIALIILAVFLT